MLAKGTAVATRFPGRLSLVLVLALLTAYGCQDDSQVQLDLLSRFEPSGYEGQPVDTERIDELKADIRKYGPIVEEKISAAGNLGSAYALLGAEYQRLGMFRLALAAYQAALEVRPASTQLLYDAGVSAGQWAATAPDEAEKSTHYDLARTYYDRVLGLDPFHKSSLYGLAILQSFQYDDQESAEDLVDRLIALGNPDTRTLFLKARILVLDGRYSEAAGLYGDIANRSTDQRERALAIQNQQELLNQ